MKPESFIDKLQADPDGLDFEGLRREGIRLVQEMSGDVWSDYNLHDPGVTILEQLCYGLTDAAYRCAFPAADYLASADGSIDYARLALYRPDCILPCAPLTEADYRKLILGSMPNLDNVWIERSDGGLYRIYVLLGEQVQNQHNEGVSKDYADKVAGIYVENRNLCEDLESVHIVERKPYELRGEIEIDGKRDPASVLAEVYAECARYLCPAVTVDSCVELYKNGSSMEQLFTGVATGEGYIPDETLHAWRGHFSIAELFGIVARIDGVDNVRKLAFTDPARKDDGDTGKEVIELGSDARYRQVVCLAFPANQDDIKVSLHKGGRIYNVALPDVVKEFGRMNYRQQALRQHKQRYDWVARTLPRGVHRELREYYSVQNHLPDIYGINANGVPESAGPRRQAQALQLKAYMLLSEQVVANFLQDVQEIPALYSLDKTLEHSSFFQVLGNDAVPGVEQLYHDGIKQMEADMAELVASMDDYGDRRNRALDYLLALYGEKFSQNSLRHFFHPDPGTEAQMIRNKMAFLDSMAGFNRNRASAFNYRKSENDRKAPGLNCRKPENDRNVSGLKSRLALLLGFDTTTVDIHIVEHILLRPPAGQPAAPEDFHCFRLSVVFPADKGNNDFRKLAEETMYMNCPAHIHPQLLWLDAASMQDFNERHGKWLDSLRQGQAGGAAAAELAAFLQAHGERAHG